jgi:hypothetical protein
MSRSDFIYGRNIASSFPAQRRNKTGISLSRKNTISHGIHQQQHPKSTPTDSDSPKLTINDQRPASQPAASSRRRRRRRQSKKLNYQRIYKISTINFISICLKVTHKNAKIR